MNDMLEKIKDKKILFAYLGSFYNNGGVANANYATMDVIGQLKDDKERIGFYREE